MIKHFVGLLTAVATFAAVQTFVPVAAAAAEPVETGKTDADDFKALLPHLHPWSGARMAIRLAAESTNRMTDPAYAPYPAKDQPLITLSSAPALAQFSRQDIRRMCLSVPVPGKGMEAPFDVNIWLTEDAHRRIADALKGHGGELGSFRLHDVEISNFTVDAQKAEDFRTPDKPDPVMHSVNLAPDFSFSGIGATSFGALAMAWQLAGTTAVEGCTPKDKPENIPGYAAVLKRWNEAVAIYPEALEQEKAAAKARGEN